MAKISEQSIEQIRNRADIIDIISSYVELKKEEGIFLDYAPSIMKKRHHFQ